MVNQKDKHSNLILHIIIILLILYIIVANIIFIEMYKNHENEYQDDVPEKQDQTNQTTFIPAKIPPFGKLSSFYGDKIIWWQYNLTHRNGWRNVTYDIFQYNLSSNETKMIFDDFKSTVRMYGDYILYFGEVNESQKIFLYKISTQETKQLTWEDIDQRAPVFGGNHLVYSQWDNNFKCWGLWLYDLETEERNFITLQSHGANDRAVNENYIVWRDNWEDDNTSEIYIYNISAKEVDVISAQIHLLDQLDLYGDIIVWEDWRNDDNQRKDPWKSNNVDIFMYNISSKEEVQITLNNGSQRKPRIYGDYIIWTDWRNDPYGGFMYNSEINNGDIYFYDIKNKTEIQITINLSLQENSFIFGDNIIWEDYRNNHPIEEPNSESYYGERGSDIYLYNLETGIMKRLTC